MAVPEYDATKLLAAEGAEGIGLVLEGLAKITRVRNAALATVQANGDPATAATWSVLGAATDYGVANPTTIPAGDSRPNAQIWFENFDAIRIALTTGDAKAGLEKNDKGA